MPRRPPRCSLAGPGHATPRRGRAHRIPTGKRTGLHRRSQRGGVPRAGGQSIGLRGGFSPAGRPGTPPALAPPARARPPTEGKHDPRPVLGLRGVFGDLGRNDAFASELAAALRALDAIGAKATLSNYLAAPGG